MFKGFLALWVVLAGFVLAGPANAENAVNPNLEKWVGTWQMTSGDYEENWTLQWTEEKTHLDLTFVSFEAGEPAFKANGFIFFDINTARLHLYMMMNNGALHENIGKLGNDGKFRLRSITYGGPVFPDHDMVVTFENNKMVFEYIYESETGDPEIYKNVFTRKNDPEN